MADITHKACTACGESLPLDAFAKNRGGDLGLRGKCRRCVKSADAARYRLEVRENLYLKRYGITIDEYDALVAQQGGKCALCGTDRPGGRWGRFVIDHCHDTGRVRGALCNYCNVALAKLGDTPASIEKVLAYVTG